MTKSEVKEFFRIYHKIDNLASEIIDKLRDANLLSSSICNPRYERIEFDECGSNLVIRYYDSGYDIYEYDTIEIPFEIIYEDKVDEYIENKKKEKEEFLKRLEQRDIERQLEKEKAEYERLKAKFEK